MARTVTCDGCGEAISPRERETLVVDVQVTTLDGVSREQLDLHGFGCLRRWVVGRENARAAAVFGDADTGRGPLRAMGGAHGEH